MVSCSDDEELGTGAANDGGLKVLTYPKNSLLGRLRSSRVPSEAQPLHTHEKLSLPGMRFVSRVPLSQENSSADSFWSRNKNIQRSMTERVQNLGAHV